jgi:precorrin-4/cobalt-precorrin-4 C11-methyltransferase
MSGKVYLIGSGPGAPDLLTLRGARAIAASDIVIWGRPFGDERLVRENARDDAEVIVWPPATMADLEAAYDRANAESLTVARMHGGDPAIYARLAEELARVRDRGLAVEVIPGVTAACAAAASCEWELTNEADRMPLILASAQASGGELSLDVTRMLPGRDALALYMVGAVAPDLQEKLLASGYAADTPCAVAQHVSRAAEVIERCTLGELARCVAELGSERNVVILVARPT